MNQASFVIRLWLEGTVGLPGEWRFQATHIQSGRELKGRTLEALLAFVEGVAEHSVPGEGALQPADED